MNTKIRRLNQLIALLQTMDGSSVKDLANLLEVSEMTIRRDLKLLTQNQVVKNVSGAAIYNPQNQLQKFDEDYELIHADKVHNEEKDRIGRCAAGLIEPEDTIIIDTGSTTEKMVPYIKNDKKLTVICYNTNILADLLKKNLSLVFAGGYFHSNTQMFESEEGIALIRRVRAKKAFISAAGIHDHLGVTCANHYEIAMKQAAISSSSQKILLADSSKFDMVKSAYFTDLSTFQTIITDTDLSADWQNRINNSNIELMMV